MIGCLGILGIFVLGAILASFGRHDTSAPVDHQQLVVEHRAVSDGGDALTAVAKKINTAEYLIHSTAISQDARTAFIEVDEDIWDGLNHQEQTETKQIFVGVLNKNYLAHFHHKPDGFYRVVIKNLAGEQTRRIDGRADVD